MRKRSEKMFKEEKEPMDEMFSWKQAENCHWDAYTVMANAIRRRYAEDDIPQHLPRIMAKIIDDGFLDSAIAAKDALVKRERDLWEEINKEVLAQKSLKQDLESINRSLEYEKNRIESEIKKLETSWKELMDEIEKEPDPLLVGAKKAYNFILRETEDKKLAAKAFNSYLLNGKKPEEE